MGGSKQKIVLYTVCATYSLEKYVSYRAKKLQLLTLHPFQFSNSNVKRMHVCMVIYRWLLDALRLLYTFETDRNRHRHTDTDTHRHRHTQTKTHKHTHTHTDIAGKSNFKKPGTPACVASVPGLVIAHSYNKIRRKSDRLSGLLVVQEDLPEESKIDWHRHETASDEQRKARCWSFPFIIKRRLLMGAKYMYL